MRDIAQLGERRRYMLAKPKVMGSRPFIPLHF
jgi:hypothetical protein